MIIKVIYAASECTVLILVTALDSIYFQVAPPLAVVPDIKKATGKRNGVEIGCLKEKVPNLPFDSFRFATKTAVLPTRLLLKYCQLKRN